MWSSLATRANLDLLDENYKRWRQDPESVDSGWAAFFEGFELGELPERNGAAAKPAEGREGPLQSRVDGDRKSTRLNSSHRCTSYAVFCLKKKNKILMYS